MSERTYDVKVPLQPSDDTVGRMESRSGKEMAADDSACDPFHFSILAGAMGHGTGHPLAEAGLAWCVSVQA